MRHKRNPLLYGSLSSPPILLPSSLSHTSRHFRSFIRVTHRVSKGLCQEYPLKSSLSDPSLSGILSCLRELEKCNYRSRRSRVCQLNLYQRADYPTTVVRP